jgi:ubiquinone/menaquinone biosynthesis C-methylase UbiE
LGPGFHAASGRPVDAWAYERYIGRWSRLFVPALLVAAEVGAGDRVLDVATGHGEAALGALPIVKEEKGLVIGCDLSLAMLEAARGRLGDDSFLPVVTDGQALAFRDGAFDAVVCQLGLQFFPDPAQGLSEFRRVLRVGRCVSVCVVSTPDRVPMWGALSDTLVRHLPDQRDALHLSFALADSARLERLLGTAGFRGVSVRREVRKAIFESFDDYWAPIERGMGLMPQVYLSLPESTRRAVREEVRARLAEFESGRRLVMSVEVLIGGGRA